MKPDWDKLMKKYADSDVALVADVDCTASGKSLCSDVGVRGYPTIKYGNPAETLQDYNGGRDFSSLDSFASSLKKPCTVTMLHLCDEETKQRVTEWQKLAPEDLDALIKEKEDKIEAADRAQKEGVEKLQARYQELEEEKKKKIDAVTEPLSLLKAVKGHLYPYKMSTLEKMYYTVVSPIQSVLDQLGLEKSIRGVSKAMTQLISEGRKGIGKAVGVEL